MKPALAGVGLAALLALSACEYDPQADETDAAARTEASTQTVAAILGDEADLSQLADALNEAGLAGVLDGNAPYTVFAPTNEAFGKLGDAAGELGSEDNRAALVAVLRGHIVPGTLTRQDIADALSGADGEAVTMETMGEGPLTFGGSGDAITVTAADGTSARLAGAGTRGSNGAVIPIDAVLKDFSSGE
ncbi:fasciclin domain-containing protein [Aurantiacibacter spongiae]|nr:fasciclin domain-containing protein [Aurantiacibacter spongiae]